MYSSSLHRSYILIQVIDFLSISTLTFKAHIKPVLSFLLQSINDDGWISTRLKFQQHETTRRKINPSRSVQTYINIQENEFAFSL